MISLRSATISDAELLFDWVNSAESIAAKWRTTGKIDWDKHCEWLRQRLEDPGTDIWIAENGTSAVGQVRLQRPADKEEEDIRDVDIFVATEARGRGIAKTMLVSAAEKLWARQPSVSLRARVLNENIASQKLFKSLGYGLVAEEEDHLVFLSRFDSANHRRRNVKSFFKSMELYDRALRTIPLATQTFSKSAMNFVLGAAPLFLKRGDGARVWDVDGNEYLDYILGLLPVLFGYRDPDVDRAIINQLERGISFSLATELEVEVAERLTALIPSADMVRFGKNGSDATSAAIRLARANTGRDLVAACGYHGWHDWYIATTARDLGVPSAVKALSRTFSFNDASSLERLLKSEPGRFAAIILEPAGAVDPEEGFLVDVRDLATRHGAVLIFDEIVTGFRCGLGGAQEFYGVIPDISCFGKAMANGMPISAIVGSRTQMKAMDDIFFSGTFGGEALSLAAARATIDKAKRIDVPTRLATLGRQLTTLANETIDRCGLSHLLKIKGPAWWPRMVFTDCEKIDKTILISLIRQETAANGLLMGSSFNLCLAHDDTQLIEQTKSRWQAALLAVADALEHDNPAGCLRGLPVRPVFKVRN